MRLVKTGLRGLNAIEVLEKARVVLTNMQGNPHFPDPVPSMADFSLACNDLEASIITTLNGGNRHDYAVKQQRLERVKEMLTALAGYVGAIAKGREEVVVSAGFEQRKGASPITSMEAPQELRAASGTLNGTIDLRWRPVHGTRMYRVYLSTDPSNPDGWQLIKITSSSRYSVTNLGFLRYYWFRVEALGARTASPMSDIAHALSIGPAAA